MPETNPLLEKIEAAIAAQGKSLFFSSTAIQLENLLRDPEANVTQIAAIIKRDPALTAAVLKVANSAQFGFVKRVTSISQAMQMLGFTNMYKLLTAKALLSSFVTNNYPYWNDLFQHSLGVAAACQAIGEQVNTSQSETYFTLGLLHDLGSFMLHSFLPDESSTITNLVNADENKRLLEAEKKVLGLTHAEVGGHFARLWGYPDIYADCIENHHFISRDTPSREACAVVLVANNMAKAMELGASEDYFVEPIPQWIWNMLQIREYHFATLVQNTSKIYREFISLI